MANSSLPPTTTPEALLKLAVEHQCAAARGGILCVSAARMAARLGEPFTTYCLPCRTAATLRALAALPPPAPQDKPFSTGWCKHGYPVCGQCVASPALDHEALVARIDVLEHALRGIVEFDSVDIAVTNTALRALRAAPRAPAAPQETGWQPIETAPKGSYEALFYVVPKTKEEGWEFDGDCIFGTHEPYIMKGWRGSWSSLSKATHWMPIPMPPAPPSSTSGAPR